MAPPWQMPKAKRRLPGGRGNALLTAVIAAVVSGLISFGITSYQDRDAAGQAHAAQVADGASQVESAAEDFYNAAQTLYAARRQCVLSEARPGGHLPPGCPADDKPFLTAEAVLGAAYANTSDGQTRRLLSSFTGDVLADMTDIGLPLSPSFPPTMTDGYYALIARCGQLIQGR